MTLSPKGNLETRVGTSSFATGATSGTGSIGGMRYYETGSTSQLLTVTSGRFYSINSSGSATIHPADSTWIANTSLFGTSTQKWASGYSISSAVEVQMAQFNNKMYLADADADLHYWDGDIVVRQGGKVRAITITSAGTGYTSATAIVTGPQ